MDIEECLEKPKVVKPKRQARTPDYYVEPPVAPEVVTAEIMATVPPVKEKKPRAPKTEAQMEAFKHMIAVRKENLAAKKAGLAVEKIAVKLDLKALVKEEKKLLAKQKRDAKKAVLTPPSSDDDESEEEVIVVKKKKQPVKPVKKSKKLIIETTDSELNDNDNDSDSDSSRELSPKTFGKTHQNKKSIIKFHQPTHQAREYKKSIKNTDDFFC